jgi:DNA (cytosine-5)-methyltransferase 3A
MSCGQIALNRERIKVENYFASEIDKHAISITKKNFPETKHLGSVVDVEGFSLPKIDLLIGGSPCQSFSFAGKRKGMSTKSNEEIVTLEQYLYLKKEGFEFEGQSFLFWEYVRLLNETKPEFFFLENVLMEEKWEKIISKTLNVHPIEINSSLVSAQNRRRLYWTNIGMKPAGLFSDLESVIVEPKDKRIYLKDILEKNVPEKYFLSERMTSFFIENDQKMKSLKKGFSFKPFKENDEKKCRSVTTRAGNRMDDNFIICHNTQPRSGDPKKGGTGHLSRIDGKSYCLDTGNTNAIQIIPSDFGLTENQFKKLDLSIDNSKMNCLTLAQSRGGSSTEYIQSVSKIASLTQSIRKLTPIECERLQTVPDNYTEGVSDTQRFRMLGNGWTVDVIKHFFSYLPFERF